MRPEKVRLQALLNVADYEAPGLFTGAGLVPAGWKGAYWGDAETRVPTPTTS
jgi:hypothetical protein